MLLRPHCPIFQNLAANVFKWYKNRSTHLFVYIFLMLLVMAGCTHKDFLCITFGCPLRHTEGTLVMARVCNKNILMHVLLCCFPFSSPTFLSFHSFSFLQPKHELVTTSNSLSTGRLVLSSINYQDQMSTTPSMRQYTLPGHTSLQTLFTLQLIGVSCKFWGIIVKTLSWLSDKLTEDWGSLFKI